MTHAGAIEQLPNAHPSWYPKVLATLARDHPDISEEVWTTAISENATANNEATKNTTGNEATS